jgi:hypothetical protein
VKADRIVLLGGGGRGGGERSADRGEGQYGDPLASKDVAPITDDDIPF